MGMERIIKSIREEADKRSQEILRDAREEAGKRLKESREAFSQEAREFQRKLERDRRNIRNVYISDGKRKSRQALLSAKEEVIWKTISAVRENLGQIEGEELKELLDTLMDKAKRSLGEDIQVFPVREKDKLALEGRSGIGPVIMTSSEMEGPVDRYRKMDLIGGFIAVASDGKKVLDMSFHGLMEREEERIRETIAKVLFGEC